MKGFLTVLVSSLIGAVVGAGAMHLLKPRPVPDSASTPPPATEQELFERGTAAIFSGEHAAAIETLRKIEEQNPKSERMDQVLFWTAFSQRSLGRPAEAVATYDRLVREFPTSLRASEAAFNAAVAVEQDLKNYEEAIRRYEEISKKYPDMAYKSTMSCARAQENTNAWGKAVDNYERSYQEAQTRNCPESNFFVKNSRSRAGFIKSNSDDQYQPLTLYSTAERLERDGKMLEAAAKLKELNEKYPKSSLADDALAGLVRIYRIAGLFTEAEAALASLRESHPDSARLKDLGK